MAKSVKEYYAALRRMFGQYQDIVDALNIMKTEEMVNVLLEFYPEEWVWGALLNTPYIDLVPRAVQKSSEKIARRDEPLWLRVKEKLDGVPAGDEDDGFEGDEDDADAVGFSRKTVSKSKATSKRKTFDADDEEENTSSFESEDDEDDRPVKSKKKIQEDEVPFNNDEDEDEIPMGNAPKRPRKAVKDDDDEEESFEDEDEVEGMKMMSDDEDEGGDEETDEEEADDIMSQLAARHGISVDKKRK